MGRSTWAVGQTDFRICSKELPTRLSLLRRSGIVVVVVLYLGGSTFGSFEFVHHPYLGVAHDDQHRIVKVHCPDQIIVYRVKMGSFCVPRPRTQLPRTWVVSVIGSHAPSMVPMHAPPRVACYGVIFARAATIEIVPHHCMCVFDRINGRAHSHAGLVRKQYLKCFLSYLPSERRRR